MRFRLPGHVAIAASAIAATAAGPVAAVAAGPVAAAGPLTIASRMMVEHRTAAADGTTRTTLVPAVRVVPGDRITVVLAYRNTGSAPIRDLVLANPVPQSVRYRGPAAASAAPDVSVDGKTFGSLATLRVTMSDGTVRPAVAADVTHVRWRLATPVTAGQSGELAFQGVLK